MAVTETAKIDVLANVLSLFGKTDDTKTKMSDLLVMGKDLNQSVQTEDIGLFRRVVNSFASAFGIADEELMDFMDSRAKRYEKSLGFPQGYLDEPLSFLQQSLSDSPDAENAFSKLTSFVSKGGLNPYHPDNPHFKEVDTSGLEVISSGQAVSPKSNSAGIAF